jgi:hypothetical protein
VRIPSVPSTNWEGHQRVDIAASLSYPRTPASCAQQTAGFYGFSLERHVPDNHMLRRIDRFVDLSDVRAHLEPHYSEVGRAFVPSGGCARKSTSFCL